MKKIRTITLSILIFFGTSAPAVFASSIDDVIEPRHHSVTFLQAALGTRAGDDFERYLRGLFNYKTMMGALHITDWIASIALAGFLLILIGSAGKMLSYAKKGLKWHARLRLIPQAIKKNPIDYFNENCQRNPDGTFDCSYAQHKIYHKTSRLSLHGSMVTLLGKIAIVSLVFLIQGGYFRAFAGRTAGNYTIFSDAYSSGGTHATTTSGYVLDATMGEATSNPNTTSGNGYGEKSGFINTLSDASISFTTPPNTEIDFGTMLPGSTAYSTHQMTIAYTGDVGYDVYLRSDPPMRLGGTEVITPIGHTPAAPVPNTNQFGVNFTANTIPTTVGAVPQGGAGQVSSNYGVTNSYAFQKNDIVLFSNGYSAPTTFTATVIMDYSLSLPAGSYATNLTYEVVPRF